MNRVEKSVVKNDVKPVFVWAKANADAAVIDRIIIKIFPDILKSKTEISKDIIQSSETIEVSQTLYHLIQKTAEDIVGHPFLDI